MTSCIYQLYPRLDSPCSRLLFRFQFWHNRAECSSTEKNPYRKTLYHKQGHHGFENSTAMSTFISVTTTSMPRFNSHHHIIIIIINNNNHDDVYGAIIMTKVTARVHPPTLRPSQLTWVVSLPKIGCYHPHPPLPLLLLLSP